MCVATFKIYLLQDLINILEEAGQEVPDELVEMADKYARWKEREAESKKNGTGSSGGGTFLSTFTVKIPVVYLCIIFESMYSIFALTG